MCNGESGEVVPIPTLPEVLIRIASESAILNIIEPATALKPGELLVPP